MRILAMLAITGFVYVAQPVLLPTALAVVGYFVLSPIVNGLRRAYVPRWIGTTVVMGVCICALGWSAMLLAEPAAKWAKSLPHNLAEVNQILHEIKGRVEEVSRATDEITDVDDGERTTKVDVQEPGVLRGLVSRTGELSVTLFLATVLLFLLLVQHERLVERVGEALGEGSSREDGVHFVRETQRQVSRYLLTITLINAALGAAVGAALALLGIPNPELWGLLAALLNYVPYIGAAIGIAVVSLVSLITFGPMQPALWPPLAYLVLNSLEGTVITPMILGKRFLMSPFLLLLWVMLWTWMWGVSGGLVAVPLLVILRILFSRTTLAPPRAQAEA